MSSVLSSHSETIVSSTSLDETSGTRVVTWPHFPDEETEAQGSEGRDQRTEGYQNADLGFEQSVFYFEAILRFLP